MTTPLMTTLEALAKRGAIRQLDYQFARFIQQQCLASEEGVADAIGFIAGVLSHELGKGNICIVLDAEMQVDTAVLLGLYGESALALNQHILTVDWSTLLSQSSVVGKQHQTRPLIFDGERLYLHRYWHYEMTLANRLNDWSVAVDLSSDQKIALKASLNRLFERSYSFLFKALKAVQESNQSTQVIRQQLVCDHLDVVDSGALNWPAIEQVLAQAVQIKDLEKLNELVPQSVCVNWQKVAAAVALTRRFSVISGGPGTGKTTTVTKLLAALIEQAQQDGHEPSIKLVAPTGKAAARLTESIGQAIEQLPLDPSIKTRIPTESSTLHRLLGAIPGRAEFRHNRDNLLHLDVLVVDEASMVDLPMMYKLIDALPKHARLILLGDKDQLASVEAGAVLGDICSFNAMGMSVPQGRLISDLTGYSTLAQSSPHVQSHAAVADSLCMLQKSYRFDARSGIGQLAKAINSGFAKNVDSVLAKGFGDIEVLPLASESYNQMIRSLVEQYSVYLKTVKDDVLKEQSQNQRAKQALQEFAQCRLLCAVREGDFGVTGLNQRIERALSARRMIQTQDELWYPGRPVMITQNDHGLGLYNGDIGICMLDTDGEDVRLKVYFELPDGSVKAILPSRVPEHETAYAMTIHKSQGSEFQFTLMILPPDFSPVLTRELVYTGVTRAKQRLMLLTDSAVLKRAVKAKTQRASGLIARLNN
ncbi:exodeoxyribonuclease V subunit alpha [Vibrio maerlii]|uniref:exodeoxyribonuclease V subunit alpha n=1 Tax=Vibrio maerlii TaxID=2231648 RepID=UPI001F12F87C|nr:exodeoxyribonuclease V subunit alpha [Vibrio maerlii]